MGETQLSRPETIRKLIVGCHAGMTATVQTLDNVSVAEMFSAYLSLTSAMLAYVIEKSDPAEWLQNKTELLRIIRELREQVEPSIVN